MNRDFLVLGTNGGLLVQPDAVEDFNSAQSAEDGVTFALLSKAYSPAGPDGEIVWHRILLTGWHRAEVAFYVTPIVDGRFLNDQRTYVRKAATDSGRDEKWSAIVPLGRVHPDYPNQTFGVIGGTMQVYIELTDPTAAVHFETASIYHDPVAVTRPRKVDE